jgi:dTDP-glucose 4,6-dehydratase
MLFQAPRLVPINVGSDSDLSIAELAHTVAQSLNASTDIHVAKKAIPGAPVARYVPSVNRAKAMLGLDQAVNLQEAIRRTAAWHAERGKEI